MGRGTRPNTLRRDVTSGYEAGSIYPIASVACVVASRRQPSAWRLIRRAVSGYVERRSLPVKRKESEKPQIERTAGIIHGFLPNFPCLWLGRIPPSEGNIHHRVFNEANEIPNQFKIGEFYINHFYQSSSCDVVSLRGIFLPLNTCRNQDIVDGLESLRKRYYDRPFASVDPNLDEVLKLRNELIKIGPLDISKTFRSVGEAYMPFSVSEKTYQWLRSNFEMVTKALDKEDGYFIVEVLETSRLPWPNMAEFTNWLFNYDTNKTQLREEAIQTLIMGAFIYPNSDFCDSLWYIAAGGRVRNLNTS